MVSHIVWDWNGTLFHDIDAVTCATSEVLAEVGMPPITAEEHRRNFTRPVWVFYERLLGRRLADGEFERFDRAFHDAYGRYLTDCGLADDAEKALATWRDSGGTQSLLSMWRHDELVPLVNKLGIAPEFVRVDGVRGSAGGRKAEHLVRHLSAIGADAGDTLLVGDSVDDADAAAHVGARCVLYPWGYASRETLAAADAPVVDTLTEALAYCY